jgi:hypothetical protein
MKPSFIKRFGGVFLTLTASAAVVMLAPNAKRQFATPSVVHAQRGCSNATLVGNYGLTFSGFQRQHNKSVPFFGAGLAVADGNGNVAATFAFSLNGVLTVNNPYAATYTVNPDCTITITATPGSGGDNFSGAILGDGLEVLTTDVSEPDTLNADLKRQWSDLSSN